MCSTCGGWFPQWSREALQRRWPHLSLTRRSPFDQAPGCQNAHLHHTARWHFLSGWSRQMSKTSPRSPLLPQSKAPLESPFACKFLLKKVAEKARSRRRPAKSYPWPDMHPGSTNVVQTLSKNRRRAISMSSYSSSRTQTCGQGFAASSPTEKLASKKYTLYICSTLRFFAKLTSRCTRTIKISGLDFGNPPIWAPDCETWAIQSLDKIWSQAYEYWAEN